MSDSEDSGPKAQINIDVPKDVVRDGLNFFQRVLGPVAEASDFISDKIRFRRWHSAMLAISRAADICQIEGIEPKRIPIKFLWPFIEKVSLEETDSPIIEKWARLLARASLDFDPILHSYSDILSRINSIQAEWLDRMCSNAQSNFHGRLHQRFYQDHWRLENKLDTVTPYVKNSKKGVPIVPFVDPEGRWIFFYVRDIPSDGSSAHGIPSGEAVEALLDDPQLERLVNLAEALVRENLVSVRSFEAGLTMALWAELTTFGFEFVQACGGEYAESQPEQN